LGNNTRSNLPKIKTSAKEQPEAEAKSKDIRKITGDSAGKVSSFKLLKATVTNA
jgi:hypothetical protein